MEKLNDMLHSKNGFIYNLNVKSEEKISGEIQQTSVYIWSFLNLNFDVKHIKMIADLIQLFYYFYFYHCCYNSPTLY